MELILMRYLTRITNEDLEKKHEPETCGRNRDEKEGDTQHQEDGIDGHEKRLLAKATSKGNGTSHAHHVRDFAYAKEKSCVDAMRESRRPPLFHGSP